MCFSATASFVAGGILAGAGAITLTKAQKKQIPLASIPLLFGIQQIIDGFVWTTPASAPYYALAVYGYSLFAFAFWPIFTPIALRIIETNSGNRKVLDALIIIGVGVAAFFMHAVIFNGATATLLDHCIAYVTPHGYGSLSLAFYLVAVVGPFLVSSKKLLKVFGVVLFISFAIAGWFYQETFSSTWCFFAAVLSSILFVHFYKLSKSR
jgi:hypothetical protein